MLYLMMSKNIPLLECKVLKIHRSVFFGTPGIAFLYLFPSKIINFDVVDLVSDILKLICYKVSFDPGVFSQFKDWTTGSRMVVLNPLDKDINYMYMYI